MSEDIKKAEAGTAKSEAEKLAAFKASKAEAAKRFKEKRAAEKAERIEKSKKLIAALQKQGVWDKLSAEDRAFLEGLAVPTSAVAGSTSLFNVIYGASPKVGDKKTLMEIFQLTQKGKSQIDAKVKDWAKDGKVVTCKIDANNILNSVYVIEKL